MPMPSTRCPQYNHLVYIFHVTRANACSIYTVDISILQKEKNLHSF